MPQYIVYAQQVLYVERVIDAPDAEAAATIADQLVQTGMLQPVNSVEFENGVLCEVVEADVPTYQGSTTHFNPAGCVWGTAFRCPSLWGKQTGFSGKKPS